MHKESWDEQASTTTLLTGGASASVARPPSTGYAYPSRTRASCNAARMSSTLFALDIMTTTGRIASQERKRNKPQSYYEDNQDIQGQERSLFM